MVDFRKWLMAFAPAALLFGLGGLASAQTTTSFICNATAGNPHIVRSEGVAELVGDVVLNCTGGVSTPYGQNIPLENIQVNLNTYVTSRLVGGPGSNVSEAILAIDEPFPSNAQGPNPAPPAVAPQPGAAQVQSGCVADGLHDCSIPGTPTSPNFGASGPYNGFVNGITVGNHFNVFQGVITGPSQVSWLGVPLDAPGTQGTRIIHITNIRANACALTAGSSLLPTVIYELIGMQGNANVTVNNPQQTVALSEKGLYSSSSQATYQQCVNLNGDLLGGATGQTGSVLMTATEGFGSFFKPADTWANSAGASEELQNIFGHDYNTESGWYPGSTVTGLITSTSAPIGLADTGTMVQFAITGVPAGVSLFAPAAVLLVDSADNPTGGYAYLVGSFSFGLGTLANPGPPSGASLLSTTPITLSGNSATLVYEVFNGVPQTIETMNISLTAAYLNTSPTIPGTGTASVAINFAPLSLPTQAQATAGPIPRFCQPYGPQPLFSILACTCDLLFPFVTNQGGFDTGVAIANTTADPFQTTNQAGTITLNYYGNTNGGAAPAPQTTNAPVPAGTELLFTLSSGGNLGIAATQGFQGYIISVANFQYCHGFAFISDLGAQKLAEGYLAISLDVPFNLRGTGATAGNSRTGNFGENDGN